MFKKTLSRSFVRYIISGLTSVAGDYSLVLLGYHVLGWPLTVATTAGFVVGLSTSFLLNKFWAFQTSHSAKNSLRQAVLMGVLILINLALTNVIVLSMAKIKIGPEISKLVATGIITLWNYVLYKKYIFKEPEPPV